MPALLETIPASRSQLQPYGLQGSPCNYETISDPNQSLLNKHPYFLPAPVMILFFKINPLFLKKLFYFWLHWVFVAVRGLFSSCSERGLLLLWSTGSRRAGFSSCGHLGSVVVARGLSCSAARGIFPDQGSNACPLHWQADSQPLRHQGSPPIMILNKQLM